MKILYRTIPLIALLSLLLSNCATGSKQSRRAELCAAKATDYGEPVEWRPARLMDCPAEFVAAGGSKPQLPGVRFPITDEATVRENFHCDDALEADAADVAEPSIGVDFATERVEEVSIGTGSESINWIAQTPTELVIHQSTYSYCGGITPEQWVMLIVVPRDAPKKIRTIGCHRGQPCSGPPRVENSSESQRYPSPDSASLTRPGRRCVSASFPGTGG